MFRHAAFGPPRGSSRPPAEGDLAAVEALMREWRLEDAARLLEGSVASGANQGKVMHDLSVMYSQQGLFTSALAAIQGSIALDPTQRAAWHHFLALQKNNMALTDPVEWRAMHATWAAGLRERLDAIHRTRPRSRELDRKLHVGYMTPDTHQATQRFIGAALAHFDESRVTVTAYWAFERDAHALAMRYPRVRHRVLGALDDAAVARLVLDDGIDILVDVAGHGAGNRLPVFAMRPAPVQFTWLDYLSTTGLAAIDYRITDWVSDPPGAEQAHVERLMRLRCPQWCYCPPASAPAVMPRSAERAQVVFGSICVPLKLSETILGIWGALLRSAPASVLRFIGLPEGRARSRVAMLMAREGIAAERLQFLPRVSLSGYLAAVADLDVALDSHPFSGATSTLDTLWQGTPVVTLAGSLSHSRSSAAILSALGRSAWVASGADDYIDIARRLASDHRGREAVRRELRGELQASPLTNARAFAAELERAYRSAWVEWVEGVSPGARFEDELARQRAPLPSIRAELGGRSGNGAPPPRGEGAGAVPLADICRAVLVVSPECDRGVAGRTGAAGGLACSEVTCEALLRGRAVAGSEPWLLISAPAHYEAAIPRAQVASALLESCAALSSFGWHAPKPPAAVGREAGAWVYGSADEADRFVRLWPRPDAAPPVVALGGPALLIRRELLDKHGWPRLRLPAGSHTWFRAGVRVLSQRVATAGGRLGICALLVQVDRTRELSAAAEYLADREVERTGGLSRWRAPAAGVAPVKMRVPAAALDRVLPILGRLCDGC